MFLGAPLLEALLNLLSEKYCWVCIDNHSVMNLILTSLKEGSWLSGRCIMNQNTYVNISELFCVELLKIVRFVFFYKIMDENSSLNRFT